MCPDQFVTLAEVKQLLTREGKERELSPEQKLALEHAQRFTTLDQDDVKKLKKELGALGFLSEQHIVKIVDLLPRTADDVRLIFAKERSGPDKKQVEQILETVQKFL